MDSYAWLVSIAMSADLSASGGAKVTDNFPAQRLTLKQERENCDQITAQMMNSPYCQSNNNYCCYQYAS